MEVKEIIKAAEDKMAKSIEHLKEEMANVRAGKATPNVLNGVMVSYYGNLTPVNQVASVAVPDARTITILPWDKKMIPVIEKAILDANIGLTPSNNGEHVRLTIPPLTEERRKQLVKQVRAEGEQARVGVRNARRDAIEVLRKEQKNGMPEDVVKDGEEKMQKSTDKFSKLIDEVLDAKEKEILTV
jgi:ribosome recycling factor